MTFLDAINKVLRGLREEQAGSASATTYAAQIAQLVNEAKSDLEDMGPWFGLRTTISDTLASAAADIDLTADTNERSYLLYDTNGLPMAFVVEGTQRWRLQVITYGELQALRALDPNTLTGPPQAVAFLRSPNGITAQFYPAADADYDVQLHFVVPQDEFTADADEFYIPADPIWREALVRAMEERGEEFAGPLDTTRARAAKSLEQAVLRDFGAIPMTFKAD